MRLMHRRADGTFVIEGRSGFPYHVVREDPIFDAVAAAAEGVELPPEPEPAPLALPPARVMAITPRQLLLALSDIGMISEEEALAAATVGSVPAAIDSIFATLPPRDAFAARVTWARMSSVERFDPLVVMLAQAQGMDEAAIDAFFVAAAAL